MASGSYEDSFPATKKNQGSTTPTGKDARKKMKTMNFNKNDNDFGMDDMDFDDDFGDDLGLDFGTKSPEK